MRPTESVCDTDRIWYAGAPESRQYSEFDLSNAVVVELDVERCRVEARRVGQRQFIERRFDRPDNGDINERGLWLGRLPDKSSMIIKLSLVGSVNLAEEARIDSLLQEYHDLLAAVEVWEQRSVTELRVSGRSVEQHSGREGMNGCNS